MCASLLPAEGTQVLVLRGGRWKLGFADVCLYAYPQVVPLLERWYASHPSGLHSLDLQALQRKHRHTKLHPSLLNGTQGSAGDTPKYKRHQQTLDATVHALSAGCA